MKTYKVSALCRGKYLRSEQRKYIGNYTLEELKEAVKQWQGKSSRFTYRDWYGDRTGVVCTISKAEVTKGNYNELVVTVGVSCDCDIPEHYYPDPYDILENYLTEVPDMLVPISYAIL